MNETKKKKAVIYCRVSTKEQVEEGNSLATQEKICKEYALKNSYDVVDVFIEQGESAKTQNRTELQRLLKYCADRKNNIQVVIAYKIDRISRNIDDYSQIRVLLKRYGVEIKSTSEHFENTPAGRFMENIIANVAQFDNDVRTERSVNGMRDAMREGRYVWKAPYGYTNQKVGGKSTIVPDVNAPLVTTAFTEVAKNKRSVSAVRLAMKGLGMKNNTGKPFSKSQFYRLLKNQAYVGWIIKFGERHKGLYEPLITQDLFDQVQRVVKRRTHKGFIYQKENPDFPLRRFVRHVGGYKLTGHWSQGKSKKYPYYRFIAINGTQVRKETLHESFKTFLNTYTLDRRFLAEFKKSLIHALNMATTADFKEAEQLRAYIGELKERQTVLIDKNCEGVISNSVLQQQLDILDNKMMQAQSTLVTLPEKEENLSELFDCASIYLKNPGEIWDKASFENKVKLQEFEFPQGVLLKNGEFRTPKIASLFKANDIFLVKQSPKVPLRLPHFEHPGNNKTRSEQIPVKTWEQFARDIRHLADIFKPEEDLPSKEVLDNLIENV